MRKCEQIGCVGHWAKFDDCLSEAVWEASLEFPDWVICNEDCGNSMALVVFPVDELVVLESVSVTVPAGAYTVETFSTGGVGVVRWESEEEARRIMGAAFSAWYPEHAR